MTSAKSRKWRAAIFYDEDETVDKLMACHNEAQEKIEWEEVGKDIAVDSAKAGIFDDSVYGRDEMTYLQ